MKTRVRVLLAAVAFALVGAVPASAEIAILSSGRTLSVKSHRYEGESIILALRNGGEVTCDKSLVDKIVPDEVPYPEEQSKPAGANTDQPAIDIASVLEATPYGEIISAVSEANGVNPLLVRALIQVESGYKPRARSRKGAMGLMQLMPSTAKEYKVRNPFDPKTNIEAGIKHLKSLIDRFGSLDLSLAAYNAGAGAVEKHNGIPPYRETRNYVSRILSLSGLK
jgi:transglycosylase-like protein with SLT domain